MRVALPLASLETCGTTEVVIPFACMEMEVEGIFLGSYMPRGEGPYGNPPPSILTPPPTRSSRSISALLQLVPTEGNR
ncbi:unnamed protein product [Strongylus vulgaris]|uniref:Uncharacterized protein n=1 Tax=Strongylus vulgaris TaxID=40348 RepID=A0A3P7JFI7_STRVU|nr:unnamed protein product [Strongylus vulgaris]